MVRTILLFSILLHCVSVLKEEVAEKQMLAALISVFLKINQHGLMWPLY
jgi:hypothetical protein